MWIVNISGQLKNSTFIATIHLKGLLIRKGYLENLDYRIRNTLNKTKIAMAKLSSHKFNILMKFSHEQCSSSTIQFSTNYIAFSCLLFFKRHLRRLEFLWVRIFF